MSTPAPHRILKLPEVLHLTADSRSGWYAKVSAGKAPRPIKLGMRAVGWLEADVNKYIESLVSSSRG
ncbi:MAG: AlpA family phage regulatory protein [Thiobacillus sp.]